MAPLTMSTTGRTRRALTRRPWPCNSRSAGCQLHVCHSEPCPDQRHEEHHVEKGGLLRLRLLHKKTFASGHTAIRKNQMLPDILDGFPSKTNETSYLAAKGHSSMNTMPRHQPISPRSTLAILSTWPRPMWIMERTLTPYLRTWTAPCNSLAQATNPSHFVQSPIRN